MRIAILMFTFILAGSHLFGQPGKATVPAAKPITIGEAHELHSIQLGEDRILNIYLPAGYNKADTIRYPVVYLLDGSLDEDYIHVVGQTQFNSQPWVGRIPPSIVVGIANTDRKRDMTFPTSVAVDKAKYLTTGGSAKFIAFIEKEVQPYMAVHFKTNNSKTIIGESLAGLLATEILLTRPSLFDKYIIISPSLWWDNGSILKRSFTLPVNTRTSIYISVGKEGLAPSEEPHVMEVDANVLKEKIDATGNTNIVTYLDYLPGENHATISHQAILNAFKWMAAAAGNKR